MASAGCRENACNAPRRLAAGLAGGLFAGSQTSVRGALQSLACRARRRVRLTIGAMLHRAHIDVDFSAEDEAVTQPCVRALESPSGGRRPAERRARLAEGAGERCKIALEGISILTSVCLEAVRVPSVPEIVRPPPSALRRSASHAPRSAFEEPPACAPRASSWTGPPLKPAPGWRTRFLVAAIAFCIAAVAGRLLA